jgi:hypothetical protein
MATSTSGANSGFIWVDTNVSDPTSYSTTPGIVYTGTGHAITSDGSPPVRARCAQQGHEMADEAEYADGSVVGICSRCGEVIRGRRMPGGLGASAMRAAMMRLLEGDGDVNDLAEQLLNLSTILDLEESQLREAKALLRTARTMLVQRWHNGAA